MGKDKWAIFDFCETLVNFQTADAFIEFLLDNYPHRISFPIQTIFKIASLSPIRSIIYRLFKKKSINKKLTLLRIKGIKEYEINSVAFKFYEQKIRPNLIKKTISLLKNFQSQGIKVMILSGGYNVYLDFFCDEFKIDKLISSQIEIRNGMATGRMSGLDCLWENKLKLLEESNIFIEVKNSYTIAFSDSISDISLLKWVNEGIVVSHNKSQEWAKENNLKEIVWQ